MSSEKRKSSFSSAVPSSKRAKPSPSTSSQPTSSLPSKSKKGISVGPANLPEGQWKRRNQRIKRSLVDKAKLRQDYRKLKTRLPSDEQARGNELKYYAQAEAEAAKERDEQDERVRRRMEGAEADDPSSGPEDDTRPPTTADEALAPAAQVSNDPHPDRQAMMSRPASPPPLPAYDRDATRAAERRQRRPKPVPFAKEQRAAERRRKEAEERRERIERARRERDEKAAERERFRRAMAKARTGGKNGQRKLGRESGVLLERVRRIMS
ncbi:hypothetical protein BDZ85DRAFT_317377 [Elsinoe ampelina]|uniref:rRNA-processing protein FYV7 n=1 Tax=Elsinoe ampelina TaxID=302913 RepID=A0A6A6GGJ3_9PEZI|nr:hypothetical protein BDZ85DRAFT_317377 [Elsinoe ampelina]